MGKKFRSLIHFNATPASTQLAQILPQQHYLQGALGDEPAFLDLHFNVSLIHETCPDKLLPVKDSFKVEHH